MKDKLLQSTLTVSIMTFLSRIMGFIRDVVIARFFGAGTGADVFFVAFKIPNFLRRLFAEGAFSQAFIPVLAEFRERGDRDLKDLIAHTSGTLFTVLFIVTAIGIIAAPVIIMVFAPGFIDEPHKLELAGQMLAVTFPYLLFVSLTAFAGAILNSFGRFAVPAFTPVFLNISLIVAAIWLSPQMQQPITALAWGVFVGGVVQLAFQVPFLIQIGSLPHPRISFRHEGVRKIMRLMLPAMFGVSVSQINLLVDTLLASFLVTGSISWLYYSDRLVEFPLGVFGIALATVILPSLSQKHANASSKVFSNTIDWALRWVFIIGTPAAVGLIILAQPMLTTLFEYGEFTTADSHQASLSLMAYGLGLLPFIFIKVLAPAYFARQDMKTPVKIGVIAMLTNIVLNVILMLQLQHVGLALATGLSAMLNAGLLYIGLRKRQIYQPLPGWLGFLARLLAANLLMGLLLWWLMPAITDWQSWSGWHRLSVLLGMIVAAAVFYLGCVQLMGVRLKTLLAPHH